MNSVWGLRKYLKISVTMVTITTLCS
jgi:hypothetical protein